MTANPNSEVRVAPRKSKQFPQRFEFLFLLLAGSMIAQTANAYAATTTLVSVSNAGTEGNDFSLYPRAVSPNGRFVCFESAATNLVDGDTNGQKDIFIRDRQQHKTTRVNVSSTGEQADDLSASCGLSANGRYVVFTSAATTLVPNDTNGRSDVFVHDRETGETTRVSVSSTGAQSNGPSGSPAISADGRLVVFSSSASTLVFGDTNGFDDIFLHDRETGITTRVSLNSSGEQAIGCIQICQPNPTISANGRFVAFDSKATNLVPGDNNGKMDLFVRDLKTGITTRVSVNSLGFEGNGDSFEPSLSANGRIVAFGSEASNLVDGDSNGVADAFVYDLQTGQLTRVSVSSAGVQANAGSFNYFLSTDGRIASFNSNATNLVPDDTNDKADIFVHNRQTKETIRISVDSFGNQGNGDSAVSPMNEDGSVVAFGSDSSNLVVQDTNGVGDTFVYQSGGGH